MAGISDSFSMYVARHSWASIARSRHIPLSVISHGMGHESESTTRIYLASVDTAVIDRAQPAHNRSIVTDVAKFKLKTLQVEIILYFCFVEIHL